MKIRSIPTFATDTGRVLQFIAVKNAPGFSHIVILDKTRVGYLADNCRADAKSARFFFEKHPAKE